jgi:uncharacterized surface protein with fasciclin (FAS1) repeats
MLRWVKSVLAAGTIAMVAACGGGEESRPDIASLAQQNPELSVLAEAVTAAGLATTLSGPGPYTVFAPTNAAFADLLQRFGMTKEALLADRALLTKVLAYHVVAGRVLRKEIPVGQPITTLQGETFTVGADLSINDQCGCAARLVTTDVLAGNGVLHVIDHVLLPTL